MLLSKSSPTCNIFLIEKNVYAETESTISKRYVIRPRWYLTLFLSFVGVTFKCFLCRMEFKSQNFCLEDLKLSRDFYNLNKCGMWILISNVSSSENRETDNKPFIIREFCHLTF